MRHLRTCPEPQLDLPQEISDLSVHYQEIEMSIKTIQKTIQDLSTDDSLTEVKRLSDFLTTDMSEMSQTLEYITQNYDSSLTFFKSFEENLDKVKEVYVNYKLHLLVYLGRSALGVLLAVKIISVFIKLVQCYPLVKDYMSDWQAFRNSCLAQRTEAFGNLEQNLPLVPIVQRA